MKLKSLFFTITLSLILISVGNPILAQEIPHVVEFELEIEMKNQSKYDIEYELFHDRFEAEYQVPDSTTIYGEDAKAMFEPLLNKLELSPDSDEQELRDNILSIFTINKNKIDEFELEVKFSNGKKIKIVH